jgi:hypothetical protein
MNLTRKYFVKLFRFSTEISKAPEAIVESEDELLIIIAAIK